MATLCRTLLPIPDGSLHSLTGEVPAEAVVTWVRALAPEDFNVSGCELLGVATSGEATLLAIEVSHHSSSLSVGQTHPLGVNRLPAGSQPIGVRITSPPLLVGGSPDTGHSSRAIECPKGRCGQCPRGDGNDLRNRHQGNRPTPPTPLLVSGPTPTRQPRSWVGMRRCSSPDRGMFSRSGRNSPQVSRSSDAPSFGGHTTLQPLHTES